jgi:hypothetical protein
MGDSKQPTAAPGPKNEQRELAWILTRKPVGLRNEQHATIPGTMLEELDRRMEFQGYLRKAFAEPSLKRPREEPEDHLPAPFTFLCSILWKAANNITWPACASMLEKEGLPKAGKPEPLSLAGAIRKHTSRNWFSFSIHQDNKV